MKKFGTLFFIIGILLCFGITVGAAGLLSPAISVMQEDACMVKTGVGKNTVAFTAADFEKVLGDAELTAVEITALPAVSDGILKLGALDVTPGQVIPYASLSALRFLPADAGKTAEFQFKPYGSSYEKSFVCTVCMLDSLNFAPTAKSQTLAAKEAVAVFSSLSAEDPDGDEVTYLIVDAPKKGSLKLVDAKTGSFRYTAYEGAVGKDKFTYVAIDRYGNCSEPATVSITTSVNKGGIVYSDLVDSKYQLAAVEMAERDVIVGEKIGGERFFYPEKTVTRADFLIMAMRAVGIDTTLVAANDSGFADSASFTAYQNRYIATARRLGLVVGMDTENGRCFCPNEVITSAQAATIISRVASMQELSFGDAVYASIGSDDEISDDGYAMLASVGLVVSEDRAAQITRADAAALLYTLTCCK